MFIIVGGHVGSDAGYWYIGSDGKLHHVGGWGVESMTDVIAALNILREATQIKTPGVAEAMIKGASEFVQREVEKNVNKDASFVIIGGSRER
jgi:hypothetical protein